jgi:hypothetical protein
LTDHAPDGGGWAARAWTRRPGRGRLRPRIAPAAALVGWALFTWYLFAQALAGPVIIWNDSKAYALVASKPLWSRAFWIGQRPPLTPLLIKVVGSSSALLAAQAAIAAIAWGILALVVGRLVAPGWRRVAAVWVILAFATALPVTLWNRSMLSESLAISMLALVFAGFITISRRVTWPRVVATAVACLGFAASRDAQVWTVALLGLAIAVDVIVLARRDRRFPTQAVVLAGCLFLVVAATEWGTLSSHRTRQDVADVLYVRVFPYPDRVAWFAAHGMPEQKQIDRLAATTPTPPGQAKTVFYAPDDAAFAPLQHWVTTKGTDVYLLWLVTHPLYVITEPLHRPERSYNFGNGDLTIYAATTNRDGSPLTVVMWPPLIWVVAMAVLASYLAVLSGVWRDRSWRVVVVLTVIGLLAMLVAWHGDGQEVTRHTIEGSVQVRLGLWVLVLLGLFELLPARTREPAADGVGHLAPDDGDQVPSRAAPAPLTPVPPHS